jgi:hypothetical protein
LLAWQDSPKASTEPESPSVDVKVRVLIALCVTLRVMYHLIRLCRHPHLQARTFYGDPGQQLPRHSRTFPRKPHLQAHLRGKQILTVSLLPRTSAFASIHFNKRRFLGSASHLEHALHRYLVVMAFLPVLRRPDLQIVRTAARVMVIRPFPNGRSKT